MTAYTNPRMSAVIENWPSGRHRVTAQFTIERHPKGTAERAVRVTTGAPKKLTYALKMRIVDGDDGKTYIAALSAYGHVTIWRGDMQHTHESVFERDPRYAELRALFDDDLAHPKPRLALLVGGHPWTSTQNAFSA